MPTPLVHVVSMEYPGGGVRTYCGRLMYGIRQATQTTSDLDAATCVKCRRVATGDWSFAPTASRNSDKTPET